jgi:hypothetical protein
VEDSAFRQRERAFKTAARYCLLHQEFSEVMSADDKIRRQYLKCLAQAQQKVMFYDITGEARDVFQNNVMGAVINRNAEYQQHLGLNMNKSLMEL